MLNEVSNSALIDPINYLLPIVPKQVCKTLRTLITKTFLLFLVFHQLYWTCLKVITFFYKFSMAIILLLIVGRPPSLLLVTSKKMEFIIKSNILKYWKTNQPKHNKQFFCHTRSTSDFHTFLTYTRKSASNFQTSASTLLSYLSSRQILFDVNHNSFSFWNSGLEPTLLCLSIVFYCLSHYSTLNWIIIARYWMRINWIILK